MAFVHSAWDRWNKIGSQKVFCTYSKISITMKSLDSAVGKKKKKRLQR